MKAVFIFLATILFCNELVFANSQEEGADWIKANQQPDGALYTSTDPAADFQSTYEARALLIFTKRLEAASDAAARAYLAQYPGDSTEILAAKLLSGVAEDSETPSITAALQARQKPNGGFGDHRDYDATAYDTYWAVLALDLTSNLSDVARTKAVTFLLNAQAAQGGWEQGGVESIYLTGRIVQLLSLYRAKYLEVPAALAKAQSFLALNLPEPTPPTFNNDNAFAETFEQCNTLGALSVSASTQDFSALAESVNTSQQTDGSWQQSVFTTALCLRAQIQYEAYQNGIPAGLNSLYGKVVVSGSAEPLKDAMVSVQTGTDQFSTSTNSSGYFSLSGITAGNVNLVVAKAGYQTVVKPVDLASGSADAGTIPLVWNPEQTAVFGEIVDSQTGLALVGAKVSIDAATTVTDGVGNFLLTGLAAGSYSLNVTLPGYNPLTTAIDLDAGELFKTRLFLNASGTVLDDSPALLSGVVVDGVSGQPVSAQVTLDSSLTVATDGAGRFELADVIRGDHQLTIAAPGFNDSRYQISFPAGANGYLGQLAIYAASEQQADSDLDVNVLVRDAINQQPIAGAQLVLSTGDVSFTNNAGVATFLDLTELAFSLTVSADGYHPAAYQVTASGYGALSTEVLLTPDNGEALDNTTVSGVVTDSAGEPIEGASVTLGGQMLSVLTDATGYYEISGIDQLTFELRATKAGYQIDLAPLAISAHGHFNVDFKLSEIDDYRWYVAYIDAPSSAVPGNDDLSVVATIQNLTASPEEVIVRGQLVAADGTVVAGLPSFVPGTSVIAGSIPFGENESKQVELKLFTGQIPEGSYRLQVDVVQQGSISADLPAGVIYASGSATISIAPTTALAGGIDFTPPLSQAGAATPIVLNALIRNAGNQPLPAGNYQLTISSEDGEVLLEKTATAAELPINGVTTLAFGEWLPQTAGHFAVSITHQAIPAAGAITDLYYVGDLASAAFTLDRYVVPEGSPQVRGQIDIRGVDTTQGTSTDPLYDQVQQAVLKGSQYVGPQALAWHNRNRCLGCHIQTQSLVGMASSLGRIDVDYDQTKFLYNAIVSSQQSNGGLYSSNPGYARTQTEFGAWSLVDWPDKHVSFTTKLSALKFLWDRRTTNGNQLYWTDEHNSGWFSINHDATTAVTVRAIADLIKSNQALVDTSILTVSDTVEFPLSTQHYYPAGSAVTETGEILIAKYGAIELFDPATGLSQTLFVDAKNRQFYDVEFDEYGVIYATTNSAVVKIEDGVISDEQVIASGLRGIEYLNGFLYISDWKNGRIWQVSPDLQATVFAAGGLLNSPKGLAVSHENTLLIANRLGYNILEADTLGNLTVYAEGFAYLPQQLIASTEPGEYYVTTERSGYKQPTVMLLREDRTLEALFANRNADNSVYSLALVGGSVYFVNIPDNRVEQLQFAELDRSLVQTLEDSLPNIANYFLGRYTRTESENLYIAFRLVGLGEIYNVINDESLKTTILSAMQHLDQLLRDRQRSDGGWGQYTTWGSDPLTTSWVGMALDYLNPSAEDPVVRNAITYLLGQQSGSGSWWGRYFSTRLGTTSMVMAYMPRALQRLAGLDVAVDLEVPANISVANMSPQPTTTTELADGSEQLQWQLTGVVSSGQKINLDMTVNNILIGETRSVANSAELAFANSFTGETLTRAIDIPSVSAVSDLLLTTATDKTQYLANEVVTISTTTLNGGATVDDGKLLVEIYTAEGYLIEQLSNQPPVTLATGEQASFQHQWNTGIYSAGDYLAKAYVVDGSAKVQVEATSAFAILPSDGQQPAKVSYAADIHSDKTVYLPYDTVVLDSSVANQAINSSLKPVLVKVWVEAPNGNRLLSRNRVISQLAPAAIQGFQDLLTLAEATPGGYTAVIEVWDAGVQNLLASDTSYFGVIDQPLAHLLGEVTVSEPSVYKGQTVSCTNVVQNRSTASPVAADIDYVLVNVDSQLEQRRASEAIQLAPGTETVSIQGYDTATLEIGGYACLLMATINGEQLTLAYGGFEVVPPPVTVSSDIGRKGRLLVLLDTPEGSSNGELSSPQSQYDYLVQLLNEQGYSYRIVFTAEAFEQELYSGNYHSYAIMSEQVTLSPEAEQILTEAVNMGHGLLISGAFNRRNGHVERALGISVTGRETQADGVLLPAGALGEDWMETVINPGIKLDFERCGARLLGAYINPVKGTETTEATCYDQSGYDAAAAGHNYGNGYAVYIGFDSLDEATNIGGHNSYRAILSFALQAIQPVEFSPLVGNVIPVVHRIAADEIDIQVRVTIDLPENVALIDQQPPLTLMDAAEGIWQWQGSLAAWQEFVISQYLQLLDEQQVLIPVVVETSLDADWFEVNRYNQLIDPQPLGDPIAEALVLLQAVGDSQILTNVNNAQQALAASDSALAIKELLQALSQLPNISGDTAAQARLLLDRQLFILLAAQ